MAITAKNIMVRQAERDAGEARHLQETLQRMYRADNDPDFELAIGRASGIAAHYATKEETLAARTSEEDKQFIPNTADEWAESLGRRKVVQPSTRNRSRSKSRDYRSANPKPRGGPPTYKNKGKPNPSTQNPPPQKKRHQQQQGQNNPNAPKKQNKAGPSNLERTWEPTTHP